MSQEPYSIAELVDEFADAMFERLQANEDRKGDSWREDDWENYWRSKMIYHFTNSNYIDLANFAAFGEYHGWKV